jgi:hypothetical protein
MRADQKLTGDARRELLLRALSGENKTYLVNEYGIARSRLYALLEAVEKDPEAAASEARKEWEFRRKVAEMLSD